MVPMLMVNSWTQMTLLSVSCMTGLTDVCYPPYLIVVFIYVSLVTYGIGRLVLHSLVHIFLEIYLFLCVWMFGSMYIFVFHMHAWYLLRS